METPTVYVICDQNCKFESMTKEQILTAITQAVETGEIGDIDTGFVQTIKTINGTPLRFFVGTQAEYDALADESKENLFAIISNDATKEGILSYLDTLRTDVDAILYRLDNGGFTISDLAVKEEMLEDGAVWTTKIADLAVSTKKIADEAVTGAKLGYSSVQDYHIVPQTITAAAIAPKTITWHLLADGTIKTEKIEDNAVTEEKLSSDVREKLSDVMRILIALEEIRQGYDYRKNVFSGDIKAGIINKVGVQREIVDLNDGSMEAEEGYNGCTFEVVTSVGVFRLKVKNKTGRVVAAAVVNKILVEIEFKFEGNKLIVKTNPFSECNTTEEIVVVTVTEVWKIGKYPSAF